MTKVRLENRPICHSGEKIPEALLVSDRDTLTLKPASVLEIDHYSDDQIACWDNEDKLDADERKRILDELQRKFFSNDRTKADGLQDQTVAEFLAKL